MQEADATLCKAKTKGKRLLTIQGLPSCTMSSRWFSSRGEIYQIPNTKGLEILDLFEGNGEFYQRKQDFFIDLVTNKEVTAWVYYFLDKIHGAAHRNY